MKSRISTMLEPVSRASFQSSLFTIYGKFKSVFLIRASQWAEPWILQELNKYARKTLWLWSAWKALIIRFEFWTERSVSDGGSLCPLGLLILKSVVGDTF